MINKRPPYALSGAERVLWRVASSLAERGHEITVFCPDTGDKLSVDCPDNISFEYVSTRAKGKRSMIEFFVRGIRSYPRVYRQVNPDIVYDNASPFAFHLAHVYGDVRRVTKVHAIYRQLSFSCKEHPIVKIGTFIGDEIYRLFRNETIITNSNSTAERAKELLGEHNRIIPNPIGIDADDFEFHTSPESKRVVSVSSLTPRKDFETLIRAWDEVEMKHPDASLVVAGNGPRSSQLKKLSTELGLENIEFPGFVSEERKHELLREGSIFVLPTLYEGFGLANLEAMASGCAVISTDTWGVRDYLVDGENGRMIPTRNPAVLSDTINTLLTDPDQVARLAKNGRETAETYSMEESTQREVSILENIFE